MEPGTGIHRLSWGAAMVDDPSLGLTPGRHDDDEPVISQYLLQFSLLLLLLLQQQWKQRESGGVGVEL